MKKMKSDLLAMNVSWFTDDLELYENQFLGFVESLGFTIARLVTLILAIIVHRAFYNLMKRLPGRAVNQIIYPSMVRCLFFFTLSLSPMSITLFHQFTTIRVYFKPTFGRRTTFIQRAFFHKILTLCTVSNQGRVMMAHVW